MSQEISKEEKPLIFHRTKRSDKGRNLPDTCREAFLPVLRLIWRFSLSRLLRSRFLRHIRAKNPTHDQRIKITIFHPNASRSTILHFHFAALFCLWKQHQRQWALLPLTLRLSLFVCCEIRFFISAPHMLKREPGELWWKKRRAKRMEQ